MKWLWLFSLNVTRYLHATTPVVHFKLFEIHFDLKEFTFNLILTRWGLDKFPKEKPLVFYKAGKPILPLLEMHDGFKVVVKSMASYIQKTVPSKTIKFWRLQSPRHFSGGDWNQNGSCLFDKLLEESQVCIISYALNASVQGLRIQVIVLILCWSVSK